MVPVASKWLASGAGGDGGGGDDDDDDDDECVYSRCIHLVVLLAPGGTQVGQKPKAIKF